MTAADDPAALRLVPPKPVLLSGNEQIDGAQAVVRDFWAWTLSDLLSNTTRPMLAEFLVARALGADVRPRIEWDSCDVVADGIRIEVKSAAALQSWPQRRPSRIVFGGLRGRVETEAGWSTEPTYNADVYVFAVIAETDHSRYAPLNVSAWEFWVVGRSAIEAAGRSSLNLATVQRLAGGSVEYRGLAAEVRRTAESEQRADP